MIAHDRSPQPPPLGDGTSVLNWICQPDMYIGGRDIRSSPHPLTYNVSEGGDLRRMYLNCACADRRGVTESVAL